MQINNLGTNRGYRVLEMIDAFEMTSGRNIPYRIIGRRPGDIPVSFIDSSKASRESDWRSEQDLEEICAGKWQWQSNNLSGYP